MSDEFELATRAFALFTLKEKRAAVIGMTRLSFPRPEDRFTEAVYVVVREQTHSALAARRARVMTEERAADDDYFKTGSRYPGQ